MALKVADNFDEYLKWLEIYEDLADLPKKEKIKKPVEKDGDVIDD